MFKYLKKRRERKKAIAELEKEIRDIYMRHSYNIYSRYEVGEPALSDGREFWPVIEKIKYTYSPTERVIRYYEDRAGALEQTLRLEEKELEKMTSDRESYNKKHAALTERMRKLTTVQIKL